MASWSIEHIPAGGGDPVVASLATWGFAGVQIQFVNWSTDQASITARGGSIAFDAAQFGYKDKIVIWRDGVRFFQGWIVGLGLTAQAQESRTYTLAGPSWWLEHLPFTWPTWPAKEELSLGERASFRWLQFAMNSAIAKGAPIAKAADNYAPFILPTPDLRASSNCLEVIQRVARLHPMSAGFWDYSGEVPVFTASLRAALTAQTVTIGEDIETLGFTPLPDQQVESVHIAYNYTDTFGAHTVHDTAGTEPYGYGPNKLHIAVDVETYVLASEAQSAGIATLLYASLSPLAWSGAVNMHETGASLPVILPGSALSVAGGRAEWATMSTVVQSVLWSVSTGANDICTVSIGAPEHLGPQDYLEFARAGTLAASSAANNPSPYDPPTPPSDDPGTPGTYDDLNGGTGGGTPSGSIPVQSRGGLWALKGLPEWTDISTPPRRYLTKQMAGASTAANTGCTTTLSAWGASTLDPAMDTWAESAYCQFDPVQSEGGCVIDSGDPIPLTQGSIGLFSPSWSQSYTRTVATVYPTASLWTSSSGAHTATLTSEDTDSAAIHRLLASAPAWGEATTAIHTIRTDGITGVYREARYRTEHTAGDPAVAYATLTGLEPWQRYQLTVKLESRPVDSAGAPTGDGSWSAAGTRTHYIGANIDGEGGIDWQTVEPTAGYETRIASTLVEVAP